MRSKWQFVIFLFAIVLALRLLAQDGKIEDNRFVQYIADPKTQAVKLYWKDKQGNHFGSIAKLKSWLASKGQSLLFAMNGGMYQEDRRPVGLYIEGGKTLSPLNKRAAGGNFYLKPNGVFYITQNNVAGISTTDQFNPAQVLYATQSGPMLVIDGNIHPSFTKGSTNINIRNGVGILPNGKIVFALSKQLVNLYDFAKFFKKLGCKNALYLDGFVSRMYAPQQQWIQTDGDFGVMIGVVSPHDK